MALRCLRVTISVVTDDRHELMRPQCIKWSYAGRANKYSLYDKVPSMYVTVTSLFFYPIPSFVKSKKIFFRKCRQTVKNE